MLGLSSLRLRFTSLFLLTALIYSPVGGFAEAPVPRTVDRHIEQSETSQPSGELIEAEELERLQARDEEPSSEVVGGALNNEHLTYVVIALAAAVLVLVLK